MFSGGYFGGLCLTSLKTAANEGVFSGETASNIISLNELSSEDVNNFVCNSTTGRGPLNPCIMDKVDEENCIIIIESLIARAAKLVAANLAAVVLKTDFSCLTGNQSSGTGSGTFSP